MARRQYAMPCVSDAPESEALPAFSFWYCDAESDLPETTHKGSIAFVNSPASMWYWNGTEWRKLAEAVL